MKISSFNGLRFYFSLLIFLNHLTFLKQDPYLESIYEGYFHGGGYCVLFFFLLSGFCFALGYVDKFEIVTFDKWLNFIKNRLKKIYPLYMLTMCVCVFSSTAIHLVK